MLKEEFIEKARAVHGDKYDYSKVEYKNNRTKVCIICPEHGEFWQTPYRHTGMLQECPKCKHRSYKYSENEFIEKARAVHGDKYDYSKVEYKNNRTKVCIICPEHGEFWQTPYKHLSGQGCPKCVKPNSNIDACTFIKKAHKIHGDKYIYSKVTISKMHTKICIICPEHGEFWQTPSEHLRGAGCPKCAINKKMNTSEFLSKLIRVHGNKYDYSKVEYINSKTKVCLICPKHGEFWKTPNALLAGQGCPRCANEINLTETKLFNFLCENIKHPCERQKKFKWLGNKRLDFYIPKLGVAIEYQGKEHFQPIEKFGGIKGYYNTVKRDEKKYNLCKEHSVKIIYVSYEKNIPNEYFDTIYRNNDDLINVLQSYDENN